MLERLEKIVRVTDPEDWYGQNTVEVSLFVTPPYKDKVRVRILIQSVDDFMVSYDYECNNDDKDHIKWIYSHLKEWMYDRMPEEIDLTWLYEHGYLPF